MEQVIQQMAKVPVTQEMLKKIDMASLIEGFQEDYKKLDNLKNKRREHESKNAVMRWWDNNELEDAQLDAAELQARFSKKLGQLMVIAITQSQMLNQQQLDLKKQQEEIQGQTEEISATNETIAEQQQRLSRQQDKLQELIDEYFELKGLTVEGAKKLILIAEEVKATKYQLLERVDQTIADVYNQHSVLLQKIDDQYIFHRKLEITVQSQQKTHSDQVSDLTDQIQQQNVQSDANQQTIVNSLQQQEERFDGQLQVLKTELSNKQLHAQESQEKETAELQASLNQFQQATDENTNDLREDISSLRALISQYQTSTQAMRAQHQKQISNLKIMAVSGLVLAVSSISAFVWQHKNLLEL